MVCLTGGIIGADFFKLSAPLFFLLFFLFLLISVCLFRSGFSAFFLYSIFFLSGLYCGKSPAFDSDTRQIYSLQGRCEEILGKGNYIFSVYQRPCYLHLPDSAVLFRTGDSLYGYGRLLPLQNTGNFKAFNYRRYLQQKGVYARLLPVVPVKKKGHSEDLFSFFQRIRQTLLLKTDRLLENPSQRALIKALCLGYKNELDTGTVALFSSTGTIHLLAVSGLHTGAVYLLLVFIFRHTGLRRPKTQLVIIPLLWGYACLTGLSPSVVRAANILSFIIIGKAFTQDYSPLNSIAASAFLTLLVHPSALYSVSMQMSYAAYTGIILLYPTLQRFSRFLPPVLKPFYALLSLTFSAQLATWPLAAFYFHSVSLGSLLLNLLAVPITTALFYSALITLLLPFSIGHWIAGLPQTISFILLEGLQRLRFLSLNIDGLYPSLLHILFIYAAFILFYTYLFNRKKTIFYLFTGCGGLLLLYLCFFNLYLSSRTEIIIYHLYGKSCILLNYHSYYTFLYNNSDASDLYLTSPYIDHYRLRPFAKKENFISRGVSYFSGRLRTAKQDIRIITPEQPLFQGSHTWIVTGNLFPADTTDRSLPRQIVLDASSSSLCIRRWEQFCTERHISLLKTEDRGSIRIPLK